MSGRMIVTLTFAAAAMLACDNQVLNVESPNAAGAIAAYARGGTQLPFRGSFTMRINGVIEPPTLFAEGAGEGNATQLGRFSMTSTAVVDLVSSTATGTFNFFAANGDQLSGTFIGVGGELIEPGVARITEVATIEGGTGRFAAATGTFTMHRIDIIDEATLTSTGSGSIDGHISLR